MKKITQIQLTIVTGVQMEKLLQQLALKEQALEFVGPHLVQAPACKDSSFINYQESKSMRTNIM